MKALVLSYFIRKHTNRNHLGIMDLLGDYCDCFVYGRAELEGGDLKEKIDLLINEHSPDVLLIYSGLHFNKFNFFHNINCLKIMIEVDYHNQPDKSWYRKNKFDYIIWRNGDDTSEVKIPGVWWPYATDENSFYSDDRIRENIIGFAGSSVDPYYKIRQLAKSSLISNGLLNNKKKLLAQTEYDSNADQGTVWLGENNKYQNFIRSVKGFLTSTENRGPYGKTFEIMASETVLLSSPILNKELLFNNKECYVEYKPDCSDIVKKAQFILNEDLTELTNNAWEQFYMNHTRTIRIKELYDNIKLIIAGKEPVRRWGF